MHQNEAEEMLTHVEKFRMRHLDALFAQSEQVVSQETIRLCVARATEVGIAMPNTGYKGLDINNNAGEADWIFYLLSLAEIASANAATAFELHSRSLARLVLELAGGAKGPGKAASPVVLIAGGNGLARLSLARLVHARLDREDDHFLRDYFPERGSEIVHYYAERPDCLIVPAFSLPARQLSWQIYDATAFTETRIILTHGLDELDCGILSLSGEPVQTLPVGHEDSLALFRHCLTVNTLGLLAMALGLLMGAQRRMLRYTAERQQGGAPIKEHAAIRLMEGQVESACVTARAALKGLALSPQNFSPDAAYALKANLLPALCQAANAALQAFGGYGYMRDYGMEKIVRDLNTLKLCFGTPTEILLYLSESRRIA